jgi:hypothetical protein
VAFVGDTAGIRVRPDGYILPPTPPPDIDLESWRASVRRIEGWGADTLFITHFGPMSPSAGHLAAFVSRLEQDAALARRLLEKEATAEERETQFVESVRRDLVRSVSRSDEEACELIGRLDLNWRGLARYWSKKTELKP